MPAGGKVRIGIVAGEVSGDHLGAGLLAALKKRIPDLQVEGIGGSGMVAEGCSSLFPMETLSVMGFTEVLSRYREIRGIRSRLIEHFIANPPDLFIGIDAPDFNLGLEEKLRDAGIPTLHYVSPTVWAWRGYRIHKIKRAVDRMLTLFPFEARYYEAHQVPVNFVGHPLADQIPDRPDRERVRDSLALARDKTIIALLPGSRHSELRAHADVFVQTVLWLHERHPDWEFVVPFVSESTRALFESAVDRHDARHLPLLRLSGRSSDAMAAADVVILASGTAALEAMLLNRLMVVTYKVSFLSYFLMRLFAHVDLYCMPNHLAGRELVPEFIQRNATPEKLGAAVEAWLADAPRAQAAYATFGQIHRELRRNASERAADAVISMLPFGQQARADAQPAAGEALP